jgi:hypothetical protein
MRKDTDLAQNGLQRLGGLYKGGDMARLGDGRILMAYVTSPDVTKNIGSVALMQIVSADGGRTWGLARQIVHDPAYNAGRPWLLRTRAGELLVSLLDQQK